MSANMFGFPANGSFSNVRVWAFNKAQMYAGAPTAQVVSFNATKSTMGGTNFGLLPANARLQTGSPPPGRENLFAALTGFTNVVRIWKFHVDWNNTANSTFTGPTGASTGTTWAVGPGLVPELVENTLDTLTFRAMMQNQYTNIGGVESLWNSHTVAGSSASQAAVRWYQVPVTGGAIGSALQASTYNPDSRHRFMPSVAVDRVGNMAIGYSVSSAAMHPAIRYSGRLAGDPPNTLSQTETSMIEGTGGQVHTFSDGTLDHRWGDYSTMTLDPDGCTFWYTNEYYVTNGFDDHTRIGSFRFPHALRSRRRPHRPTPPTRTPTPRTPTPNELDSDANSDADRHRDPDSDRDADTDLDAYANAYSHADDDPDVTGGDTASHSDPDRDRDDFDRHTPTRDHHEPRSRPRRPRRRLRP